MPQLSQAEFNKLITRVTDLETKAAQAKSRVDVLDAKVTTGDTQQSQIKTQVDGMFAKLVSDVTVVRARLTELEAAAVEPPVEEPSPTEEPSPAEEGSPV